MFKSDASLFLEANNNLGIAKSYIYECKRIMSELGEISGNNDSSVLKSSIENCDVDTLVTKVETTKNNLLLIDQNFATTYMSLLESQISNDSLDISSMSEEEEKVYNMYDREYHQSLLFILEQYEAQGRLTDEMKDVLTFERLVSQGYDIQDKMSLVSESSDQYLSLFEQYGSIYRQMIQANPDLTDAKKAELLSSYETQYNTTHGKIESLISDRQEREADYKELASLIQEKDDNSDFWHPIVEGELQDAIIEKKKKLGIATDSEIEYSNMSDGEKFWEGTKTFGASLFTGLFSVPESIVDGGAMIVGEIGGIWSEDFKSQVGDFVATDYAGGLYTGITNQWDINSVSAYSGAHTYGNAIGSTVGYVALSYAAPWVSAVTMGLSAMGSTSQKALLSGATYDEAFGVGTVAGVAGAIGGGALSKFNAFAGANTTSLLQVGRNALIGGGISTFEPIVNSIAEYEFYGKNMVDADGNPMYDNIWDYYVDSGGLANTFMSFVVGGLSSGIASGIGLKTYKYKQQFNANMDAMSDVERSKAWEDYFKKKYGADAVTHDSGRYNAAFDVALVSGAAESAAFYSTANPHGNFSGMKPQDQLDRFNSLVASGKTESEALSIMLDEYEAAYVPDWAKPTTKSASDKGYSNVFRENLQKDYTFLVSNGDSISWDDYLKMQLQVVPYNPQTQIPKTYANWQKAVNSSSDMAVFWKAGDISNLVNNNPGAWNYGNGLGRAAEGDYSSAAFTVPGSQCQLPDNWDSMTKAERTSWVADTVKLDPSEFSTGCYKISIDKSIIPDDGIVPSTSQTLGANGAWASTMTPMGSDVYEAIIPRVEDLVTIDPDVQRALNTATAAGDQKRVMKIFDRGLRTGKIKPRDGVTITRLY